MAVHTVTVLTYKRLIKTVTSAWRTKQIKPSFSGIFKKITQNTHVSAMYILYLQDDKHVMPIYLHFVDQYVWKTRSCQEVIHELPVGAICASSGDSNAYSSR